MASAPCGRTGPYKDHQSADHDHRNEECDEVSAQGQGHGKQDPGRRRQRDAEFLVESRELRHGVCNDVSHNEDCRRNQNGWINQRGDQTTTKTGADAEVGNILLKNTRQIAAALARRDYRHVYGRKRPLRLEGLG